jgi:hypothetical protein
MMGGQAMYLWNGIFEQGERLCEVERLAQVRTVDVARLCVGSSLWSDPSTIESQRGDLKVGPECLKIGQ